MSPPRLLKASDALGQTNSSEPHVTHTNRVRRGWKAQLSSCKSRGTEPTRALNARCCRVQGRNACINVRKKSGTTYKVTQLDFGQTTLCITLHLPQQAQYKASSCIMLPDNTLILLILSGKAPLHQSNPCSLPAAVFRGARNILFADHPDPGFFSSSPLALDCSPSFAAEGGGRSPYNPPNILWSGTLYCQLGCV